MSTGRAKHILIALTACLLAGGWSNCRADEMQTGAEIQPARRFQLSASMNGKAQLSRAEINPDAVRMGSLTVPPGLQAPPDSGMPTIMQQPLQSMAPRSPGSTAALQAQAKQNDAPNAFLNEYNVNWSGWVSTMADRWFYNLRTIEYHLGLRFETPRPALIQFTCYADGTIGNVILKQSSGVPAYDRLQIETLLAAPVPAFPTGTKRTSITLVQGWESHPKREGEHDYQPGSFGRDFPAERVRQWVAGR